MLRRHCFISRRGVTMQGIAECAQHIGFDTIGMKMTFGQLTTEGVFPCILHWNQNHFVVCYDIQNCKNGKYKIRISDPATQRLTYEKDEFLRCWIGKDTTEESTGVALMLEPGEKFGKVKDRLMPTISQIRPSSSLYTSYRRWTEPYKRGFHQPFQRDIYQSVPTFMDAGRDIAIWCNLYSCYHACQNVPSLD